jgi:hypothetical protein
VKFRRLIFSVVLPLVLCACTSAAQPAQPTVDDLKRALNSQLQKLKSGGFEVRTVLFDQVIAGRPTGSVQPFQVTATIHDYGRGDPPNRYYGQTCVGRMDKWTFKLSKDEFDEWVVDGRMTVTDRVCKDNPAEGVSATPVTTLTGTPAPPPSTSTSSAPSRPAPAGDLLTRGEYACYGTGGRLMVGMGFHLRPAGTYDDLDGTRGGTYTFDAQQATVRFAGGFLDGQVGRNVTKAGFAISSTVNCEPWK